jgi:hypothetical protein
MGELSVLGDDNEEKVEIFKLVAMGKDVVK